MYKSRDGESRRSRRPHYDLMFLVMNLMIIFTNGGPMVLARQGAKENVK